MSWLQNPTKLWAVVARDFQNNALDQDLATIPGLGSASIVELKVNGITKTDHLVGHFFLVERDEVKFIELLESMNIQNKNAREVAHNFVKKFGSS
jgi:hypothetical protein